MASADEGSNSLYRHVVAILIGGVTVSFALLLSGLILSFINPQVAGEGGVPLNEILGQALALKSPALLELGIIALLLTPLLRVATALSSFTLSHDKLYAGISIMVLAILLASLSLAIGAQASFV